ncbi:integrin alpha-PS3 [Anabrus simplex]|uniref:integrin alpha-PS3 n=1 Tax=Anabrus simplex TaxID=316456 RepID=UPI0035A3329B
MPLHAKHFISSGRKLKSHGLKSSEQGGFIDFPLSPPYKVTDESSIVGCSIIVEECGVVQQCQRFLPKCTKLMALQKCTMLGIDNVAVGAYLSGHAVLLKTSPVVNVHPRLFTNVRKVNINDSLFEIAACLWYSGKYVPSRLSLQLTVFADPALKRVEMLIEGVNKAVYTFSLEFLNGVEQCRNWTAIIRSHPNFTKPIEFTMEYKLMTQSNQQLPYRRKRQIVEDSSEYFCKDCPILDPAHKHSILWKVPYSIGCNNGSLCMTDLSLSANFVNITFPFVIGSQQSIKIRTDVLNKKEPAFQTKLAILIPVFTLKRNPSGCPEKITDEERGILELRCDIGNPLRQEDGKQSLELELDMSSIPPDITYLQFRFTVQSTGEEQNVTDNHMQLTLPLKAIANVVVSGNPIQDQIVYGSRTGKNGTEDKAVHNNGPSPVRTVNLNFKIPVGVKISGVFHEALNVFEPVAYLDEQAFRCESEFHFYEEVSELSMPQPHPHQSTTQSHDHVPSNRSLQLDCSHKDIQCMMVSCSIGPLIPKRDGIKVTLNMLARVRALEPLLGKRDIIVVRTVGEVKLMNATGVMSALMDKTVQTTLLGKLPYGGIDTWLLIISTVAGVLILLLIISCLIKCGFFKRRKQEDLKECEKRQFPTENVFVFDSIGKVKNKL